MPFEVLLRFGRWDDVLAEPDHYPDYMPLTKTLRLAARAVALAAKGDKAGARREIESALRLAEKSPFPEADDARKALGTL